MGRDAVGSRMPSRHPVLLAAAVSLIPGCFLFHGFDDPPPSAPDAGPTPTPTTDASRPPSPRVDGGTPSDCVPAGMTIACTNSGTGAVPVGVPYELPLGRFGCYCGETLACEGRVVGPREIALESLLCVPPLRCDGCNPFITGTCSLPPLEEGMWHATVNGRDAFDFRVSDATPGLGPVDACVTLGGVFVAAPCPPIWTPTAEPVDQICSPATSPPGAPILVEVTDFCLPCGRELGSCEVLRTASDLRVIPTSLPLACDVDCGDECSIVTSPCVIPPLERGDYTVHVDGLPGSLALRIDGGLPPGPATSCSSAPED